MSEADLFCDAAVPYAGAVCLDVKASADEGTLEGYASTFGNVDLQGDVVLPAAFTDTIKKHGGIWPLLMAHSTGRPVGFVTEAAEDAKGLWFKGEFTPDSEEGRNAKAMVRHALQVGHKPGVSIGYRIPKGGAEWDEATNTRKLKTIDLLEISLAMVPANPRARVARAKAADWTVREFEQHLRDVGLPLAAARKVASGGWAALDLRDVEEPAAAAKRASDAFMAEVRRQSFMLQLTGKDL